MARNSVRNLIDCQVIIKELVTPYSSAIVSRMKRTVWLSGDRCQSFINIAQRLRRLPLLLLQTTQRDSTNRTGEGVMIIKKVTTLLIWVERMVLLIGALLPTAPFASKMYIIIALAIIIADVFVVSCNSEGLYKKIAKLEGLARNSVRNLIDCQVIIKELVTTYSSAITYLMKRTVWLSGDTCQSFINIAQRLRRLPHLRHDCRVIRSFARIT